MKHVYHGDLCRRPWTKVHEYAYVQRVGSKYFMRRDDGKRVTVSRKRFDILSNDGRLISSEEAK